MPRTKPLPKREREICSRLVEFREMKGWSRAHLARMAGINRFTLATIENGRAKLTFTTGYRLCGVMNASLRWLATGRLPANPFTPIIQSLLDKVTPLSSFSHAYDHHLRVSVEARLKQLENSPVEGSDKAEVRVYHPTGGSVEAGNFEMVVGFLHQEFAKMDEERQRLFVRRLIDIPESIWKNLEVHYENVLTKASESFRTAGDVKIPPQWPALKKQLQKATEGIGGKPALAKLLDVDPTQISQWLSDKKGAREPGGEYVLQLKFWLENVFSKQPTAK